MSEYWVSHKKYFCRYCDIYIADDAPSRSQHENGLRHKGNKERYVRNLYKKGEKKVKDAEEEKREIARIDQAANAAYARDVAAGHAPTASSSKSKLPSASTEPVSRKPAKPASAFENYTTAESLGYTDPDEEKRRAAIELRRTQGLAGQWEAVAPPPPPLAGHDEAMKNEDVKDTVLDETRIPQQGNESERTSSSLPVEDDDDTHTFKLRKRKLDTGFGEDLWDPGVIRVKAKVPKTETAVDGVLPLAGDATAVASSSSDNQFRQSNGDAGAIVPASGGDEKPKWTPKGWKRAMQPGQADGDIAPLSHIDVQEPKAEERRVSDASTEMATPQTQTNSASETTVKLEEPGAPLTTCRNHLDEPANDSTGVKLEVKEEGGLVPAPRDSTPSGGLFRRRKIPAKR